ncbi:MAG: succinylglutamate desuccinylase/aspartoacylase family protein [Pseudomonadota bacterium]
MNAAPKNRALTIGDTTIQPGESSTIHLPVADLYTATALAMPIQVVCGKRAGPTLFVSAAVHGDELNGVEIIRRLLARKTTQSIRGTLIAVPIVNVHGFLDQSRYLPDRRDLNRSFPGSPKGSIAARLAHTFMQEVVTKADVGIDLHTGAIHRSNLPQIRANLGDSRTAELAQAFGAPVIIDANVRDGSLRESAADQGLPFLIYEAGEALRFDELSITAGVRGIVNVMRAIDMLAPSRSTRRLKPVLATDTRWVRAPESGIISRKVPLGARVRRGQRLATVGDPLGNEAHDIVAPVNAIVIGRSNLPLAHEGDALFNLAEFDSVTRAEDKVEQFTSALELEPLPSGNSPRKT